MLGTDPAKFLEKFEDWYEHHELLADTVGVQDNKKLQVLLLWGGKEFRKFAKDAGVVTLGDTPDTLVGAIGKIRTQCDSHVNLSMAMFKLMHTKQGSKTFTEFANEVDELAKQCQLDKNPYTTERAAKDALIFGTADETLRKEALAKDFDFKQLRQAALGYEQSRNSAGKIKQEQGQEDLCRRTYTEAEVNEMVSRITAGKFSIQSQKKNAPGKNHTAQKPANSPYQCPNCPPHYRPHTIDARCPARTKTCVACKQKDHFAGAKACPMTVKRIVEHGDRYTFEENEEALEDLRCIETVHLLNHQDPHDQDAMVSVKLNGIETEMFVDSGCKRTLLPASKYQKQMGPLSQTNIKFRPYGTDTILKCHGTVDATIVTQSGAMHSTQMYVVEGHLAEPLLGRVDALALGVLNIKKEGRSGTTEGINVIADDLRAAGIRLAGGMQTRENMTPEVQKRLDDLIERHASLFKGIGLLKGDPVKFEIDTEVPPVGDNFRPIPLAYQDRLSDHLQVLRDFDKIEDVDATQHDGWISNVVITEKKSANQIRMNIDMKNANKALKQHINQHIETIEEIRHKLRGATRFSEMDLSHGYHQIALSEESRDISTFQTHEGLHRFKVLFFGASPATDLFHQRIKAALAGLEGCMSIHDNILVHGIDDDEHERNLEACLARLEEQGLSLRREKCNFGKTSITWFGYIFSAAGMSADPTKIEAIKQAGRPENASDMKSFLQACQFNAKFMFSSDKAYAQLTHPLRLLTRKNARFDWTKGCEAAYQKIMQALTSDDALRPFHPNLKTKLITDASPYGISASIYQEQDPNVWRPVDHASRSLTPTEQNYAAIEKESLAQAWGMNYFRYHLLGIEFESFTDHEPLLSIFGGKKKGNSRVERHRIKTQGFNYTLKHLPGKDNPADFASRHPTSNNQKTGATCEVFDEDDELCISKIITSDLPDALTLPMIRDATSNDPVSQKLVSCLKKGYITDEDALKPFRKVFSELTSANGVILKGEKLYIPDVEISPGAGSLQRWCVDLAHEGHQGETKTKKLIRSKVWFPGVDALIEEKVQECLGCQATTPSAKRDPLKPTTLPERPWADLATDFWGPLPSGEYLLVVIDKYTRYPEVEIVSGTSANAVVPHMDKIFATHGFPDKIQSDGGPPFNGSGSHLYYQYMKWAGVESRTVAPEDPEANGLAENFMKSLKKLWHTAIVEKKNPKQELYKFLRNYRATPHATTGRAPAELLYNRRIKTRLPQFFKPTNDTELRARDTAAKAKQKHHKDNKKTVQPHNIGVGDSVLLRRQTTKSKSCYDPDPFLVTSVQGTQITGNRDGNVKLRDAQKFKKVRIQPPSQYRQQREPFVVHESDSFSYFPSTMNNPQTMGVNGNMAAPPGQNNPAQEVSRQAAARAALPTSGSGAEEPRRILRRRIPATEQNPQRTPQHILESQASGQTAQPLQTADSQRRIPRKRKDTRINNLGAYYRPRTPQD